MSTHWYGKLPKGMKPKSGGTGISFGEQRRLDTTSSDESLSPDSSLDRFSDKKPSLSSEPACVNPHRWESSLSASASNGLFDTPSRDRRSEERVLAKQNSQPSFLKTVRGGAWFRRDRRLNWEEYFKLVGPLEFTRSAHTRDCLLYTSPSPRD